MGTGQSQADLRYRDRQEVAKGQGQREPPSPRPGLGHGRRPPRYLPCHPQDFRLPPRRHMLSLPSPQADAS